MIKPYVISLEQVKSFLSIADTSKDADIEKFLPVVTNDMTRKNGICNQSFLLTGTCNIDGTAVLSNVNIDFSCLEFGSTVRVNGQDSVVTDADEEAKTITVSDVITGTSTDEELQIRTVPYGAKAYISQLVAYQYNNAIANSAKGQEVTSKGIGPVSVQFASGVTLSLGLDARFGYPKELIKALASIRKPRFF